MTNETTASQPKSIGDDAQFQNWLVNYTMAVRAGEDGVKSCDELVAYIHAYFRAPAAQASATIQAEGGVDWLGLALALEDRAKTVESQTTERAMAAAARGLRLMGAATIQAAPEGYALVPLVMNPEMMRVVEDEGWTWEDLLGAAAAITDEQYATIQEPVMVAEPVGALPPSLTFYGYSDENEHFGETILDYMRSRGEISTDDLKVGDVLDVTAMWTQDQQWRVVQSGNPFEVERILPLAAPMVADPAGVVLTDDMLSGLRGAMHCKGVEAAIGAARAYLAANVKAIPSEALDAGRYRWLRFADLDALAAANWPDGEVFTGEDFDKAIDAAMNFAAPQADKTGGGE